MPLWSSPSCHSSSTVLRAQLATPAPHPCHLAAPGSRHLLQTRCRFSRWGGVRRCCAVPSVRGRQAAAGGPGRPHRSPARLQREPSRVLLRPPLLRTSRHLFLIFFKILFTIIIIGIIISISLLTWGGTPVQEGHDQASVVGQRFDERGSPVGELIPIFPWRQGQPVQPPTHSRPVHRAAAINVLQADRDSVD